MQRADAAAGKWMMSLATKMNMKPGATVRLVEVPSGLLPEFGSRISATTDDATSDTLVVFVANQAALENHEAAVVESASADRLTWLACPKGGQPGTDLNRDILWELLAALGCAVRSDDGRPVPGNRGRQPLAC
jgi:hypothetical protein